MIVPKISKEMAKQSYLSVSYNKKMTRENKRVIWYLAALDRNRAYGVTKDFKCRAFSENPKRIDRDSKGIPYNFNNIPGKPDFKMTIFI